MALMLSCSCYYLFGLKVTIIPVNKSSAFFLSNDLYTYTLCLEASSSGSFPHLLVLFKWLSTVSFSMTNASIMITLQPFQSTPCSLFSQCLLTFEILVFLYWCGFGVILHDNISSIKAHIFAHLLLHPTTMPVAYYQLNYHLIISYRFSLIVDWSNDLEALFKLKAVNIGIHLSRIRRQTVCVTVAFSLSKCLDNVLCIKIKALWFRNSC